MILTNGPWNDREIADSGSVLVRMCIYQSGTPVIGEQMGEAVYEPADDRLRAFWSHNNWLGTLEGEVPA